MPETEAFYHRTAPSSSSKAKMRPGDSHLPVQSLIMPQERIWKEPQADAVQQLKQSNRNMDRLGPDIHCSKNKHRMTAGFNTFQATPLHGLFNLWFKALVWHPPMVSLIHFITMCVVSRVPPLAQTVLLYSHAENNCLLSSLRLPLPLPLPHPAAPTV